jgi:peptidoglycan/xylan/chitin deacetylase (PgdA/CDA1 family)
VPFITVVSLLAAACAESIGATPASHAQPAAAPPPLTGPATPTPRHHHRTFHRSHARVPILMYHALGPPPPGAPYPLLYTSQGAFQAQLRALRAHGYHAVTLRQAWRAWHGWGALPTRPIVLTFDDGFGSVYRIGLPAMRAYHWPGDLFLLIDHLDQPGDWGMTTRQVNLLVHAGWELDAHTYTEVDLPALSQTAAWHDIHASRLILRRRFHQRVRFFCYPVGAFDPAVVAMVRRAGFVGAVTTVDGIAAPGGNPYTMPRIRVSGNESPAALLQSLTTTSS